MMSANDLPAELILEIASHTGIDYVDQIHLALTCRQFYRVMISQILADESKHVREVMIPDKRISIYQQTNAKRSISSSQLDSPKGPFMGTYRKLRFCPGADPKDLRCFRRILLLAPQLKSVTMHIPESSTTRRQLVAYINACVGRPNLELTISGRTARYIYDDNPNFGQDRSGPGVSLPDKMMNIPPLRSFFNHSHWSSASPPALHLPLISRPQISSLNIENEDVFRSRISSIVNDLMKRAPITSFSISRNYNTVGMSEYQLAQSLSSLSMPALTHLSFMNLPISLKDLFRFLGRHPLITDLTLGLLRSEDTATIGFTFPSTPFLTRLSALAGTAQWLLPFLKWQKHGHFSELRHLKLRKISHLVSYDSRRREFYPVYNLLIQGNYKSLTLEDLRNSDFVEWIVFSPTCQPSWAPPLQLLGVEELIVEGDFTITKETRAGLLEWIDDHCPSLAEESPSANLGDDDAKALAMRRLLERFIWYTCPRLQVLQLGVIDSDDSPVDKITRPTSGNSRH